jgi:hypothetical protein
MQLSAIKVNPKNPRLIKDAKADKLMQSLLSFPQMLSLRPIVVDASNIALGGNMRLSTIKRIVDLTPDEFNAWISNSGATEEAAQVWQQVRETKKIPDKWILKAADLTEDQQREFTIKDNVSGGEWDWDVLANEWDAPELVEWGLDLPGFDLDSAGLSESFSLPDGDKAPFQQMTFTLADEQATVIQNAIADIKQTEEYKYAETMGNENTNGNALYLIVASWAGQRI